MDGIHPRRNAEAKDIIWLYQENPKTGTVHAIANKSEYEVFRFEKHQGGPLDNDGQKDFNKHFKALREDTPAQADGFCTTMMNASTPAVYLFYAPDLIIIDECVRAQGTDFWYLMGN